MLTCPFCRAEVPDDSRFCDQCGKEFKFCPDCGKPKRGTICAACGAELVSAESFFGGALRPVPTGSCMPADAGDLLVGDGLSLKLSEGVFGRRGGIWPAFSSYQYVSGIHGCIGRQNGFWTITDLGSTNGTRVNGRPLPKDEICPIKVGDTVEIATSTFVVK